MIIPYDHGSSSKTYNEYYTKQIGGDLPYFSGSRVQKGHGIGGVFSRLFKGARPILTQALKTAGKELFKTGTNIAKDALQGKNLKESVKSNFVQGGVNLLDQLSNAMDSPKPIAQKRKAKNFKRKNNNNSNIKRARTLTQDIFA